MPKWVRKAKAMGVTGDRVRESVATVINDSVQACKDLQFVLDHTDFVGTITVDANGLALAEQFYRDRHALSQRLPDFPDDLVERLLGLLLGQVFVESGQGCWVTYEGKFHVFHPVVIQLVKRPALFVQPFLVCTDLRKKTLPGAMSGTALKSIFENPEKHATR